MTGRALPNEHQLDSPADTNLPNQQILQQAQEEIYQFIKNLVNNYSPETVLLEFKQFFIFGESTRCPEGLQALYKIIFNNDEEEFKNTLKRACYILVNNWNSQRKCDYIQELLQILTEVIEASSPLSPSLKRLRAWVVNFIKSEHYQELKLFALPYTERGYWSHRYTSFLLVPQYLDSRNPKEQRELAREVSKRLKEKFKFDLAMYTARWDSTFSKEKQEKEVSNPTQLGEGAIHLIKKVITRTTLWDYTNQAHIFLKQTREYNYKDFKRSLQDYLFFEFIDKSCLEILSSKLSDKLDYLYDNHHRDNLNVDLLLRTCRQLIECLTTKNGQEPSYLFILLTSQGSTLTLVIVLLKIILICQYVQTHLEVCIAKLIRYYEKYQEKDCQWFIDFLEIYQIVFALYTENVQYNLVKVKDNNPDNQRVTDLDTYRIFSQFKGTDLRGNDLSGADIRNSNLSAADLREANLCGTDLTQADLSLAKLSRANMSRAILNGAELIAADLNNADLSSASLSATKLRCASLRQANLSRAMLSHVALNASDLCGADLQYADLQYADLSNANLSNANLSGANLQYANLSNTNLSNANLSGANLQYANLSNANLQGAKLSEANLTCAELEQVNLYGADLKGAKVRYARLSHANLEGANLSRTDLSHADLRHGDLRNTDLSDALLRHVNLSDADLSHANLRGANLFNTNLDCANVNGVKFGENSELFETFEIAAPGKNM